MLWTKILLRGSLATAVFSLAAWTYVHGNASEPPPPADRTFLIQDDLDADYLEARLDPAGKPGFLRFAADPGARPTGVGTATVFPEDGERPALGRWLDLTGLQIAGGALDLRDWVRERSPSGTHYLNFGVWLEQGGRTELRTGWTKFEAGALRLGALRVTAPVREAVEFAVTTAGGQPVPGAMLAVDRSLTFQPGLVSYFLYTDERGLARISGLESDRDWIVRLPDGAGPGPAPDPRSFDTPLRGRLTLSAPQLTGDWQFFPFRLRFPIPGGSARVMRGTAPDGDLASVWPVSPWAGPGRGPATPFWMMRRQGEEAHEAKLTFLGFEPCTIDVTGESRDVRLDAG